jgi:hypothetical protein
MCKLTGARKDKRDQTNIMKRPIMWSENIQGESATVGREVSSSRRQENRQAVLPS